MYLPTAPAGSGPARPEAARAPSPARHRGVPGVSAVPRWAREGRVSIVWGEGVVRWVCCPYGMAGRGLPRCRAGENLSGIVIWQAPPGRFKFPPILGGQFLTKMASKILVIFGSQRGCNFVAGCNFATHHKITTPLRAKYNQKFRCHFCQKLAS